MLLHTCNKVFYVLLIILLSFQSFLTNAQKPNIIYIMTDDLGYADLSCYGRKDYQTPNLDKLAAGSMQFMNAYAAAPVCTPTRAAFMTGLYPAKVPVGLNEPITWSLKDSAVGLSPSFPSIAKRLGSLGYDTYLVGKWHLGFDPQFSPLKNGFDYFFGFHGGGIDYISHQSPRGGSYDLYENNNPIQLGGYMTDLLKDKAVELISRQHTKPFFLSLQFSAPHWPWQAPGDKAYADTMLWTAGGSPATYAAMMKSLDDAVGTVLKTLEEKGLSKNTIVIFTSDNGGEKFSDMGIYKGRKMQLWEGGIRVPAFVRWPGKIKPQTTGQLAITMDWTATILALAGAKGLKDYGLNGIDLSPVLTGKRKEISRSLYWRIFQRIEHKAMREDRWKYFRDEKGNEYLFDLSSDPSESKDLKDSHAAVFSRLKQKYASWEASVLKPIPLN
jgi:arylsulfatase A-like enzyme